MVLNSELFQRIVEEYQRQQDDLRLMEEKRRRCAEYLVNEFRHNFHNMFAPVNQALHPTGQSIQPGAHDFAPNGKQVGSYCELRLIMGSPYDPRIIGTAKLSTNHQGNIQAEIGPRMIQDQIPFPLEDEHANLVIERILRVWLKLD